MEDWWKAIKSTLWSNTERGTVEKSVNLLPKVFRAVRGLYRKDGFI